MGYFCKGTLRLGRNGPSVQSKAVLGVDALPPRGFGIATPEKFKKLQANSCILMHFIAIYVDCNKALQVHEFVYANILKNTFLMSAVDSSAGTFLNVEDQNPSPSRPPLLPFFFLSLLWRAIASLKNFANNRCS